MQVVEGVTFVGNCVNDKITQKNCEVFRYSVRNNKRAPSIGVPRPSVPLVRLSPNIRDQIISWILIKFGMAIPYTIGVSTL